jgi:small subunit ribosomal protein S6
VKIYETMVLLDPEFAGKSDGVKYVEELIQKHGGQPIRTEKYADQRLAYEIRKRKRGIYILGAFRISPESMTELTRTFNLDEHVLRHIMMDRTGLPVEKFFRWYDQPENHQSDLAEARASY